MPGYVTSLKSKKNDTKHNTVSEYLAGPFVLEAARMFYDEHQSKHFGCPIHK